MASTSTASIGVSGHDERVLEVDYSDDSGSGNLTLYSNRDNYDNLEIMCSSYTTLSLH